MCAYSKPTAGAGDPWLLTAVVLVAGRVTVNKPKIQKSFDGEPSELDKN